MEYELLDTGIFNEDRYLDVFVEYAKQSPEDTLIRDHASAIADRKPPLCISLPTLLFRNTWTWWPGTAKPVWLQSVGGREVLLIAASHQKLGDRYLYCEGTPSLLFTENETNTERIFGTPNATPYVKDAFHNYIVHGKQDAVNPAAHRNQSRCGLPGNRGRRPIATLRLRLSDAAPQPWATRSRISPRSWRRASAKRTSSIARVTPERLTEDEGRVLRQALAGMLWTKQYFGFDVDMWLEEHGVDPIAPRRQTDSESASGFTW